MIEIRKPLINFHSLVRTKVRLAFPLQKSFKDAVSCLHHHCILVCFSELGAQILGHIQRDKAGWFRFFGDLLSRKLKYSQFLASSCIIIIDSGFCFLVLPSLVAFCSLFCVEGLGNLSPYNSLAADWPSSSKRSPHCLMRGEFMFQWLVTLQVCVPKNLQIQTEPSEAHHRNSKFNLGCSVSSRWRFPGLWPRCGPLDTVVLSTYSCFHHWLKGVSSDCIDILVLRCES